MMFQFSQTPGRTAMVKGKEYLYFSGYSYLGMNHVPEFIELVKEGIDKYGLLHPSSRISNTTLDLFTEFEQKLADLTNAEAAVCFSSGFLAGRAVMEVLKTKHENIFCAPNAHPTICDERNTTQSFDEWKVEIIKQVETSNSIPVVVFDSVNPLTAEVNDVSFLKDVSKKIVCVIDDSHGIGLIGKDGKGVSSYLPANSNIEYVITYSLSKAFGLVGGAVSCRDCFATKLRASSFYAASTSIAPAFAYAFLKGQVLYWQQRERLRKSVFLFQKLAGDKLDEPADFPVFVLDNSIDEKKLEETGIIISSFAYPDPAGKKINRIIVNALHTEADLITLSSLL